MNVLRSALYGMLPRSRRESRAEPGQAVLSTKTAAALLCAACSLPAGLELSEVPYYGLSPPVYPSPLGNGSTDARWASAYGRARDLVSRMTVEEKANVTRGWPGICVGNTGDVPRLGIPSLCFADGPAGLRGQEFVSAFPAGIHVAATFDRDLMLEYGRAIGREFRGRGVNVALGPVAGPLGRVARGGRNWEGLSNDPYLAGVGMGAITRGIQEAGVIATPKHWLLNEQEFRRRRTPLGEAISANVDDRTLHELYVFPFMDALREGAGAVMCSYQRANHSYACQNSKLLNGILKTELGFEGFVVSDWDAQMSGVASANAGLDLVMPNAGFWGAELVQAVRNGSVSEERLGDMAARILASWYYLHQENDYPPPAIYTNMQKHFPVDVQADHAKLIEEIGAAGTVLVKNINNTLPFKKPRFLCVYGYDATVKAGPWQNRDRYGGGYEDNFGWNTLNGTLITAGGSGGNSPPYVVSPFQALQERLSKDRGILRWDFYSENPTPYVNADACLVFINAYASESFDRTSLTDDFSDRLVLNVASWCANTIVVVHSAGIRTVDAWITHPNVTATLFAGLPGQESGHALAAVLYGDVNPSGRLPYTVARAEADYGALLNSSVSAARFPEANFTERLWIDYRAFDRDALAPRFEFGFGLSYTSFAYAGLAVSLLRRAPAAPAEFPDQSVPVVQGGHPALWEVVAVVRCTVTNTGAVEGAEVAQLYVGVPGAGEDSPVRQLRGFVKVGPLVPGQAREAVFELTRRDLSVWDVVAQQWRLRRGRYAVWVGASSRDLRLAGDFVIE
ncbi:glycoside hydrolase family 3 protein [Thermothielavioides terrestris NRRL 8126]|uniref:Beta-glucosidase cel3A n=1 Tax=Thermothielavioides terrestris (strain ATCC 38088 / NRRL 8126) TaxID=578455 RepID=G2QTM7_THETT|nr:glycoside hydrolase family 3 protein [Thermothielavioides terrestris NRRL 8126]AEO64446.1 glycoside hydrolase family 3 protein [Thermothielavioides terrestris NRRL 8126]